MKLKAIRPAKTGNMKCVVHLTGKLGFSQTMINKLQINESKYVVLAVNEEDKKDDSLYMQILNKQSDDSFKINKAGNYFYVNAKNVFDELEIDYKKKIITFDIKEIDNEGEKIYKLVRREEKDRKQKS